MGLRMEWDINSEIKVDIATFTIPLALARNLGLRYKRTSTAGDPTSEPKP